MTVSVQDQLLQIAAGTLAGGGLGLLLDLFRQLQKHLGAIASGLLDILYLLVTAVWVFHVGMGTGGGMQLFFLGACGAGLMLYLLCLSRLTASGLDLAEKAASKNWKNIQEATKHLINIVKKVGTFLKNSLCK